MTKAKRNAWMAFYPASYLKKTTRLTTEQHGAYMLLILDSWVNGAPPDDDAVLAAITRLGAPAWKRTRSVIAPFFDIVDGKWTNERVEEERAKANTITSARSMAGKAGASRRWPDKTVANATHEPKANGTQTTYQPGSQSARQTDAPLPKILNSSSTTESGSAREGSGMKHLSSGTNEIIRQTLQAKSGR